jgi:hypothetical protein
VLRSFSGAGWEDEGLVAVGGWFCSWCGLVVEQKCWQAPHLSQIAFAIWAPFFPPLKRVEDLKVLSNFIQHPAQIAKHIFVLKPNHAIA